MLKTLKFLWNHPITSQDRLGAFIRWFRWQLGSRLLGQPILADWVGETKLIVETGMTGATGNLYSGLHEFSDMAFVLHFLRPDDGFVDIGANIGSYSILASGVAGAHSYAFEPHPDTYAKLRRNILANNLKDLVTAEQTAIGSGVGRLRFTADRDTMNQVVSEQYSGATLEVPVISLDDALAGFSTALWKIDVEGFEEQVIEGAEQQLQSPSLKAILLETETAKIIEWIRANGFTRMNYSPIARALEAASTQQGQNSLWIRDEEFCLRRVQQAKPLEILGVRV